MGGSALEAFKKDTPRKGVNFAVAFTNFRCKRIGNANSPPEQLYMKYPSGTIEY